MRLLRMMVAMTVLLVASVGTSQASGGNQCAYLKAQIQAKLTTIETYESSIKMGKNQGKALRTVKNPLPLILQKINDLEEYITDYEQKRDNLLIRVSSYASIYNAICKP
jgi:hypothetical protein